MKKLEPFINKEKINELERHPSQNVEIQNIEKRSKIIH